MYYTYVLYCVDTKRNRGKFYIGSTENVKQRVFLHTNKRVKTTKSFDNISLVYLEMCLNKEDAVRRELQLKTGFGRGYIKRRIENYLTESRVQFSGKTSACQVEERGFDPHHPLKRKSSLIFDSLFQVIGQIKFNKRSIPINCNTI